MWKAGHSNRLTYEREKTKVTIIEPQYLPRHVQAWQLSHLLTVCCVGACHAHWQAETDQAHHSNNCPQEATAHEAELQEGAAEFRAHVRNTVSKQNSAAKDALDRFEAIRARVCQPSRVAWVQSKRTQCLQQSKQGKPNQGNCSDCQW